MPSNALDYITIKGFKSIASVEKLQLRPINILIGPNGSGKSNFIGAFSFLHAIREGRLQDYVTSAGGSEKLLHFGSKTTREIYFRLSFLKRVNQYELKLSSTEDDSLFPSNENVCYTNKHATPSPYWTNLPPPQRRLEAGISSANLDGTAKWVRELLGGWRLYHVHDTSSTSPMR
jgi:predicted ATPase